MRHVRVLAAIVVAAALTSACTQDGAPVPGATPSADANAPIKASGAGDISVAPGGPNGLVWDQGAEAPVPNIRLRLVRNDTGEVLDETRSGGDGLYRLKSPDPAAVGEGTELALEILLPPDHVFAYGYETPTPFPAGTDGPLEHHVMLVGP